MNFIESRAFGCFELESLVVGDGKTVRLITDMLNDVEHGIVFLEEDRFGFAWKENLFVLFSDGDNGKVELVLLECFHGGAELTFSTVDDNEVGYFFEGCIWFVLGGIKNNGSVVFGDGKSVRDFAHGLATNSFVCFEVLFGDGEVESLGLRFFCDFLDDGAEI